MRERKTKNPDQTEITAARVNKRVAFVKHVKHVPLSHARAFPAQEEVAAMARHIGSTLTPSFPFLKWGGVGVGVGSKSGDGGRGGRRAGKLIFFLLPLLLRFAVFVFNLLCLIS